MLGGKRWCSFQLMKCSLLEFSHHAVRKPSSCLERPRGGTLSDSATKVPTNRQYRLPGMEVKMLPGDSNSHTLNLSSGVLTSWSYLGLFETVRDNEMIVGVLGTKFWVNFSCSNSNWIRLQQFPKLIVSSWYTLHWTYLQHLTWAIHFSLSFSYQWLEGTKKITTKGDTGSRTGSWKAEHLWSQST